MQGKNALDFVLSAEAGKNAHLGYDVVVLSNDHGFDPMLAHLKEHYGVDARRLTRPAQPEETPKSSQSKKTKGTV
jgi:hypothetical protein